MPPQKILIAGIGGFGREVVDIIDACNNAEPGRFELVGSIDDRPNELNLERLKAAGVPYLGTSTGSLAAYTGHAFVIGIAESRAKRILDMRISAAGLNAVTLIHPSASMGRNCNVGSGAIVCAGARLTTNISVGRHTHIHVNATVGHDTTVKDYASIYPQGAISGAVVIERGATIGANATVLQGLSIGAHATVGAGAVVTKDVDRLLTVRGVPAKPNGEGTPIGNRDEKSALE